VVGVVALDRVGAASSWGDLQKNDRTVMAVTSGAGDPLLHCLRQSQAKEQPTMTITINASAARERENQTDELTEAELSKVIGGSQSSGAGAGKILKHDVSITKTTDATSPIN
jgi:hypothetical protein